ncbi:MAG: hypothetical protein IM638_15175 [Bacteroidetes bacterium]|nr:hypothetical protein [Bacteroidota bacterium]
MKKIIPLFSITLLFMYSCNEPDFEKRGTLSAQNNNPVPAPELDKGEAFLLRFYTSYIHLQGQDVPPKAETNKLLNLWCTPELIARLEKAEPEADPFLNTQDVDAGWAVTLQARKKSATAYEVSFLTEAGGKRIVVPVTITETATGYKIASVNGY